MNTIEELKTETIHKLTLLDTSSYRCIRIAHNNKSLREARVSIQEPRKFRSNLHSIYNSLSLTELQDLYNIRKGYY